MRGMLITGDPGPYRSVISDTLFNTILLIEIYVGPTIYLKMNLTLIHENHAFHLCLVLGQSCITYVWQLVVVAFLTYSSIGYWFWFSWELVVSCGNGWLEANMIFKINLKIPSHMASCLYILYGCHLAWTCVNIGL